jgi:hypothetical protein
MKNLEVRLIDWDTLCEICIFNEPHGWGCTHPDRKCRGYGHRSPDSCRIWGDLKEHDRDRYKTQLTALIENVGRLKLCESCTVENEGVMMDTEAALLETEDDQ